MADSRWTLVEYGRPKPLIRQIAMQARMDGHVVRGLIEAAGRRVAGTLSLRSSPIEVSGEEVRAKRFAGMIALGPRLEIEIAPKFIGSAAGWQDDFFLIALLAKHGHILEEGLSSSTSSKTDLPTLLGRALVVLYWKHRRRPIRTYRRAVAHAFDIDGDFDPVDLSSPEADGYPQDVTSLTRANDYNGALRHAAHSLALVAQDAETRLRLERVVHDLPAVNKPSRLVERRLPSRSRAWRPAYQLSLDVLRGLSGSMASGGSTAPAFVVDTWRAWEALLSFTARSHFGGRMTRAQRPVALGKGRKPNGTSRVVSVTPDLIVDVSGSHGPAFLVDAKYKGDERAGSVAVEPADLYESLAFAKATGLGAVCLVYPAIPEKGVAVPVGTVRLIENIEVDGVRVSAIDVSVVGLSAPGGLRSFSQNLGSGISSVIEHGTVAAP